MVLTESNAKKLLDIQKYFIANFINDGGIEEFKSILKKEMFGAYGKAYDFLLNNGNSITPDFAENVGPIVLEVIDWGSITFSVDKYKYAKELITLYYKDKLSSENTNMVNLFEEMKETLKKVDEVMFGNSIEGSLEKGLIELENEILEYETGEKVWFKTGLKSFDKYIEGLIKGKVYLLSAYSNTGKSKLSYFIANNVLKEGASVAYFSLEVTSTECLLNLTSNYFGVDYADMQKGKVKKDFGEYSKLKLRVYDNAFRMDDIERIVLSTKPDIVFIDYAQLVKTEGKSEYEQLNDYSRRLKVLSKKAKCGIFHLSQVANDGTAYKKGGAIPAKGSGELVAAADVVFIMQPNEGGGLEVHIAKHRYGQKGAHILLSPAFSKGDFMDEGEVF